MKLLYKLTKFIEIPIHHGDSHGWASEAAGGRQSRRSHRSHCSAAMVVLKVTTSGGTSRPRRRSVACDATAEATWSLVSGTMSGVMFAFDHDVLSTGNPKHEQGVRRGVRRSDRIKAKRRLEEATRLRIAALPVLGLGFLVSPAALHADSPVIRP